MDINYMFLGNKAATFDGTSDGSTILARPFFNVSTGRQDSVIIAYPDQQTGTLNIRDANELNSVEVLFRRGVLRQCNRELDFLVGYRYGRFNESIGIDQSSNYISHGGTNPRWNRHRRRPISSTPRTNSTAPRSVLPQEPAIADGRSNC